MNVCQDHDCIVIYTCRNCPLCNAVDEHNADAERIDVLEDEVETLRDELTAMKEAEDEE